ncbi:helix-turn-helix transcriptional regulator [Amycolatopsis xylanica]|nr:helix-turn-helix transcriptional regulator [Amycolatopsis xylanica]
MPRNAENSTPMSGLLTERRRLRGLSQHDLAEKLQSVSGNSSITREVVSRWERGKRIPGPYWRHWLGHALEMPPCDLESAASRTRDHRRAQKR